MAAKKILVENKKVGVREWVQITLSSGWRITIEKAVPMGGVYLWAIKDNIHVFSHLDIREAHDMVNAFEDGTTSNLSFSTADLHLTTSEKKVMVEQLTFALKS